MLKICTKCGEGKELSEFGNQSSGKFGKRSTCKKCKKINDELYMKTKAGVVTRIYMVQKSSSKKRCMDPPSYTKSELSEWLLNQNMFHKLYDEWVLSNYKLDLSISVNRIDDYAGYSFDNIELTTWKNNRDIYHRDVVSGKNNKRSKAVLKLSLNGDFIEEYYSIHEAARRNNMNVATIHNVCSGKQVTSAGYKWIFREEIMKWV